MYRFKPLEIRGQLERILAVPDTHSPFEDRYAWKYMLGFAKDYKPHTIIHVGDFGDCYSVSDHVRDPRRAHNFLQEAESVRELRSQLDGLKSVKRKVFCLGNHEARLERYCAQHAPALLGVNSIDSLYKMSDNGWRVIPYGSFGSIGHLNFTHDVGRSGANALRATAAAVGKSIIIGHTHRLESLYWSSILGEQHVAASLGWLGDFDAADYVSSVQRAPWVHGFATVDMTRVGTFRLQLHPVV